MSGAVQFPVRKAMEIGQILNRTFQLVKANLKVMVGISAAPPAVMFGLLGLIAAVVLIPMLTRLGRAPAPEDVIRILLMFVPLVILVMVLYYLVFALNMAASAYAGVQADYGLQVTFGSSYAVAWNRAGRYFLLLLIIYTICFFPSLLIQLLMFAVMGFAALHKSPPNPLMFAVFPLAMLLQTALLVVGFIIALRFSLAFPAAVSENLTAVEALRRSNWLTRGARLKIFLVLLAVYAASYLVMMVLMCGAAFIVAIGAFAFSGADLHRGSPTFWILVITGGVAFMSFMVLFMACSWAAYATALAVIYNDQRRSMEAAVPNAMAGGAPA